MSSRPYPRKAAKRYLTVRERGIVTLPPDIRHEYHLDNPGVQLELVTRPGVIELRPQIPIPADQAWFWTPEWQNGERAVDAQVAAGKVTTYNDVDEFLVAMDRVRKTKRSTMVTHRRRRARP
ncbi:MAG: AbrB/MazE/SpoVT family DNA-binding domain-containing protein [Chloroflexi bacterium]|nr:MAG: AbrB/MazE/SpoVT family DNA-binding domain-containing protein [Chloroflexota bacterium]